MMRIEMPAAFLTAIQFILGLTSSINKKRFVLITKVPVCMAGTMTQAECDENNNTTVGN
jgi:hypothetical protein